MSNNRHWSSTFGASGSEQHSQNKLGYITAIRNADLVYIYPYPPQQMTKVSDET